MKVLVRTALNPYSGYGNDGLGILTALLNAGVDTYVEPTFVAPPLPPQIAALLTKRLEAPFDLLIHHADPAGLGISPEARRAARATVAWTMWEYTSLDNLPGRSTLRKRLRDYDLVLGYDQVTTAALGKYVTKSAGTLQGGFWPEDWPPSSIRDWSGGRFGFCMVGQLHQRKDPFVAINAFKELKQEYPQEFEPAELHLKTNVPGLHQAMEQWVPKLRVHYSVWPTDTLREFYHTQHVLLAPSRGEGKNVPALEFLSTGGTVIATNWGGHTQWLSPAIGYPLDYTLAAIDGRYPNCHNARASVTHLKELMLQTFRDRDTARRKGDLAAQLIPDMCSWTAVLRRLFDLLADTVPGGKTIASEYRFRVENAAALNRSTRTVSAYPPGLVLNA